MRFNPSAFDRHLASIGQQVFWRRSYSCACTNPDSGQPDPKHALCGGKGRIWDAPIETVTGIASQKVQMQWAQMGMYEAGDMVLSIPQASPLWDAGQYDRVTALNAATVFSQPLVRGGVGERLLFKPAGLTRCFWLNPTTRAVVDGAVPAIDADGRPSWAGGAGEPPPGFTYSLTGTKFPEYFIWGDWPSDRNQHSGMRLPKRVVARKFDLFGR
jgi:hypothetical protein